MGSQQQATIRFVVSTADAEHDLKLFHKRVETETKRQQESQIKAQASPENVRYQKDAEYHAEKLYKLKRQERDMVEAEDTRHYMAMKKQEDYDKRVAGGAGGGGMRGVLSGFGGKMIMAHAGGIVAGDILGDQHGGREIGAAVGGFMFGGPMVGAAVIVTMQNYLAEMGAWVTVIQGVIFVLCVLAFRRGLVGEIGSLLKVKL